MDLTSLNAISPVDGRYRTATRALAGYFSEMALIKYRVTVEIEYLIALACIPLPPLADLQHADPEPLRDIYRNFSETDAAAVKTIERTTNHDVKAVEYFIKEQLPKVGWEKATEFVHFGLTSQDINNTAMPLALKEAWQAVLSPALTTLCKGLMEMCRAWKQVPMLARTHGQPASPTTLGKELYVFVTRLLDQLALLEQVPFTAKLGGATGNFNAHHAAYPEQNWIEFADHLVNQVLGLKRLSVTTQIEPYDHLAAFMDGIKRLCSILIDLSRDIWTYISLEYFKQKIKVGEVGSSTMPHKVNPIDFENAEGNLGLAVAVCEHLAAKLPISRLQRDLTDSTVTRNTGVPLAHVMIGLKSLERGLGKLILNEAAIRADLENNWAVVAEGVQTILRRVGYPQPYEALKDLTRTHTHITADSMADFIDGLDVAGEVKAELKKLTPHTYVGILPPGLG